MAEQFIWGNLTRGVNDGTTIDEAIAEAIDAHMENTEAHLGQGESLETHRENPVIDHPAESVPNDKLYAGARAYTAIVDPSSESDFATIKTAVDYTASKGGGTVLVKAGTHTIGERVNLPLGVNLRGEGLGITQIVSGAGAGAMFTLGNNELGSGRRTLIESLSFVRSSRNICALGVGSSRERNSIYFEDVGFEGGGVYITEIINEVILSRCKIIVTTAAAMTGDEHKLYDCEVEATGNQPVLGEYTGANRTMRIVAVGTNFDLFTGFVARDREEYSIYDRCRFSSVTDSVPGCKTDGRFNVVTNSRISARASQDIYVRGTDCKVVNNEITAETPNINGSFLRLSVTSARNVIEGNSLLHEIKSDRGVQNQYRNNVGIYQSNYDREGQPQISSSSVVDFTGGAPAADMRGVFSDDGSRYWQPPTSGTALEWWLFNGTSYVKQPNITLTGFTTNGTWRIAQEAGILFHVQNLGNPLRRFDLMNNGALLAPTTVALDNNDVWDISVSADGKRMVRTGQSVSLTSGDFSYLSFEGAQVTKRNISPGTMTYSSYGDWITTPAMTRNLAMNREGTALIGDSLRGRKEDVYKIGDAKFVWSIGNVAPVLKNRGDYYDSESSLVRTWVTEDTFVYRSDELNTIFGIVMENGVFGGEFMMSKYPSAANIVLKAARIRGILLTGLKSNNKMELYSCNKGAFLEMNDAKLPALAGHTLGNCSEDGRAWAIHSSANGTRVLRVNYAI